MTDVGSARRNARSRRRERRRTFAARRMFAAAVAPCAAPPPVLHRTRWPERVRKPRGVPAANTPAIGLQYSSTRIPPSTAMPASGNRSTGRTPTRPHQIPARRRRRGRRADSMAARSRRGEGHALASAAVAESHHFAPTRAPARVPGLTPPLQAARAKRGGASSPMNRSHDHQLVTRPGATPAISLRQHIQRSEHVTKGASAPGTRQRIGRRRSPAKAIEGDLPCIVDSTAAAASMAVTTRRSRARCELVVELARPQRNHSSAPCRQKILREFGRS